MKKMNTVFLLAASLVLASCGQKNAPESGMESTENVEVVVEVNDLIADPVVVEIESGLTMRILREGNGAEARSGQPVSVHYTGWLYDADASDARGEKFDSSVDRGVPFEFPLGQGRVIKGWDRGVVGMKIGEIRELTIAPELAYGSRSAGAVIGPDSTLVFEVELVGIADDGAPAT